MSADQVDCLQVRSRTVDIPIFCHTVLPRRMLKFHIILNLFN